MKKALLLLLVLCMSLTLLVGCTGNTPDQPVDSGSGEAEVTTDPGAGEVVTPKPYGTYDGAVFTIINSPSNSDPSFSEVDYDPLTLKNEAIPQAVYKRTVAVESELDIEIYTEVVYWEGLNPYIINSDLAGGGDYDALVGRAEVLAQVVTGGYYYNLEQIDNLDLDAAWWDTEMNASVSIYPNTTFFAAGDMMFYDDYAATTWVFNKTLVNDEGMNPYSWVENNEWTMEKFAETVTDLSKNDGDGDWDDQDTYGFVGNGGLLSVLLIAGDLHLITRDSDGYPIMSDRTTLVDRSYEIFLSLIQNPDVLIVERELGYAKGDLVFPNGRGYFTSTQVADLVSLRNSSIDPIGILPAPKYDSTQSSYYAPCSHMYMSMVVVPRHHADLAMTGDVLDCMGEKSMEHLTPVVIEQQLYYRGQVDEKDMQMLTLALENKRVDIGVFYNWAGLYDLTYQITHYQNFTMQNALETNYGDINTAINKTVEAMRLMLERDQANAES